MPNKTKRTNSYSLNASLFVDLQLHGSFATSWVAHFSFIAEAIVVMHIILKVSADVEDSLSGSLYLLTGFLKVSLKDYY